MSADGYIARSDGDVEWLNRRPAPRGFYGMVEFYASCDTVICGRKTYDFALSMGQTSMKGLKNYVFSHGAPKSDAVEYYSGDVAPFAKRLRAEKGKNVWICGGADVIAQFLDAGEVDEFSIHVVPVFIGEGIPLIAPRHRDVLLELIGSKTYRDGVVGLHYRVIR